MKKKTLIAKFNRLKGLDKCERKEKETPDHSKRVTILDGIQVAPDAMSVLAKGPKFTISPSHISREKLQHTIQVETAALAYALRWHAAMSTSVKPTDSSSISTALSQLCPFHKNRKEPPRSNMETEKAIQGIQMDLQRLIERTNFSTSLKQNITKKERAALTVIRNLEDTTITRSDKGGELVVMKTSRLQELCLDHLSDQTTYKKLDKNSTDTIRKRVNTILRKILTRCEFPESLINRLETPTTARTQQFYALPKTHKPTLKIRPIVSACGGIFDRLGWFLQQLLKPLLNFVTAHLRNTEDLITRFEAADQKDLRDQIPVSFDVISLYTNINTEEAIDTTLQYVNRHRLYLHGLESCDLWELMHLILDNNIFQYRNLGFYQQIRGLAMGNRLSGTLAIVCMDRFERLYIYKQLKLRPTLYVRYVDDVGTTVRNLEAASSMLDYLNSKHDTIKFEMELPGHDGYLPLLDISVKINEDGTIDRKLFMKAANKGIILHFQSHHPSSTKEATARNELQRAMRSVSAPNRDEALNTTRTKLLNNGYPRVWISEVEKRMSRKENNRRSEKHARSKGNGSRFVLKIPFISDQFNHAVKRILTRHNAQVRLVNDHGKTLNELVKVNDTKPKTCRSKACPAPGICQKNSLVYCATCVLCKAKYVGMTTRTLHERAREHVLAAKKHSVDSAFGDHYDEFHPSEEPRILFEVVVRNRDPLRLHIEEALTIKRLKPALNRRQEDMGTGFLP